MELNNSLISSKDKWYEGGLAFQCQQCGQCCSGPEEGYIWLSKEEMTAISKYLGLTVKEFRRQYCYSVGTKYSIKEQKPSNDCIFLRPNEKGQKICQIYELRPLQCRTWPFWKENLRSPEAWEYAGEKCSGINKGTWHGLARIRDIKEGRINTSETPKPIWQAACDWLWENQDNTDCLEELDQLFTMLDNHIEATNPSCENCGKCCDFALFDHRLYVTTLEMLYFIARSEVTSKEMSKFLSSADFNRAIEQGKCPFQDSVLGCRMRKARPSGCRIFFCRDLVSDFQNELSEQVNEYLKRMHQQYHAVYYYRDFLQWLKELSKSKPTG